VAVAYSIINGRFTRSELLKASGADIKSPLSKAVRFAWFIDGESVKAKSLRSKYENDKLDIFGASVFVCAQDYNEAHEETQRVRST
jgi:hypothetical protein